ncbi:VOC family protein [Arthrobacter sp. A5]|uniref:VOC family protein n=1 Tax=Arthrobacter sp. A5 TaxID=576926 RepID=UPI003DAA1CC7
MKAGTMFGDTQAFSGFSVDNVSAAKKFYGDTLGLKVSEENGMLRLHLAGGTTVLVYPSRAHTPGSFTILNFPVADIEGAVGQLNQRGVHFEHYEGMPNETDERGIFRKGGPLIAWFKDPAGNVLSVLQDADASADA